jgi:hypothetical protein
MSEPAKNLRQDLVLGLIYPAVLGSIFYTALGELTKQATALWTFLVAEGAYDVSFVVTVKCALLFIAIAFYFCDYLYILFTNDYHSMFFLIDLVFIVTMYLAFAAIGLDGSDRPPSAKTMLLLYLVFMALYYKWDKLEIGRCKNKSESDLFRQVVRWEKLSIAGIVLCWLMIMALEYLWPRKVNLGEGVPGLLVAVVMAAVTFYFARYTAAKRQFSLRFRDKPLGQERIQPEGSPSSAAQPDGHAAG